MSKTKRGSTKNDCPSWARPRQCSGMTPERSARDETACNTDDSTADGIEGNHTGQHERQDDRRVRHPPGRLGRVRTRFPATAEENCGGEERSAGLREPKPMAEPSPIASDSSHARMLGQRNERHRRASCSGLVDLGDE